MTLKEPGMDWYKIEKVVTKRYDELINEIIKNVRDLPCESKLSGDDSPYKDVWEEFASQIQGEQSIFFELYTDIIEGCCQEIVKKLDRKELTLLWTYSSYFYEDHDLIIEHAVEYELYDRILRRAADYNLPYY